jgi:hypothetical protein
MNNKLIDISGTIEEFSLSSDEVSSLSRYILDSVSGEYMRNWETNIDGVLHQTKTNYKNAIYIEQPDDYSLILGMSPRKDKLALMLEEGATSFDIKAGMEKSAKKHMKKDGGWYITVPFRWATSEAIAESSIFASKMPKAIEKLVKMSSSPIKQSNLPKGFDVIRTSSVGYIHQSSIYAGIGRSDISSTNKEKRGGYWSFRRISDTSADNSWVHPGFPPLKLMEKTLNELQIDAIVDRAVDEFLSKKFN